MVPQSLLKLALAQKGRAHGRQQGNGFVGCVVAESGRVHVAYERKVCDEDYALTENGEEDLDGYEGPEYRGLFKEVLECSG